MMMRRLTHPKIQTRLAALMNAVLAVVVFLSLVPVELVPLLLGVQAAAAQFLSAWYDPEIGFIGPSGDDLPRWIHED